MDTEMTLMDALCMRKFFIQLLFLFALFFFLLSIVSTIFVESGTATYVVSVINVVTLGVVAIGSGAVTYVCNNRLRPVND